MAEESTINAGLRTLVDGNKDTFIYGLSKNYHDSNYEDPTYLGFTIEIDDNSALFNQVLPFLEKQGAIRPEFNARKEVYKDFIYKIKQVFNSQESVIEKTQESQYIKQHYINSIKGLENLEKKFNKWREDKLSVELYEDITMFSSYVAHLYNNLIYSYENGRAMIPENLLKFNLKIKISEIRNLTSIAKLKSSNAEDQQIANALKNNITCLVYTLYDCEFDFFGAKPFEDTITQAGINSTPPGESILTFDIYFKSVARSMYNPLIKNSLALNDNYPELGMIIVNNSGNSSTNGQQPSASGTAIGTNGDAYQSGSTITKSTQSETGFINSVRKPSALSTYSDEVTNNPELSEYVDLPNFGQQRLDLRDYNAPLAPDKTELKSSTFDPLDPNGTSTLTDKLIGKDLNNVIQDPTKALNNLTNQVKTKVTNSLKDELHKAEQLLKQKRNELVKSFINDVTHKVGIKTIIPDNVYTKHDFTSNALDQLKSDVGLTIANDLKNILTGN